MSSMELILFLAGGALLIAGAEMLVRGGSRLAVTAGVSPLVVGLTVVAFGTSSPELAVTVGSAHVGEADVALGNVVGSNIFNVLFILGISALVTPLAVARQLIRTDVPIMIGASLLTLGLALDGRIGRLEGLLLVAGIVAYTLFLIRSSRRGGSDGARAADGGSGGTGAPGPDGRRRGSPLLDVLLVLAGLGLLVLGSRWFVEAAVALATGLGVGELVIGLTIVAAGTSLPEVATSVLASLRGERDIAVGNVIGSNIFNLLAVLGLGGVVAPDGIAVPPGVVGFDLPVMTGVAVATLPIFFTGWTIARWEGAVFLGYYAAYTVYLVLQATEHAALPAFGVAVLGFVVPLTVLTLGIAALRALGRGENEGGGRG